MILVFQRSSLFPGCMRYNIRGNVDIYQTRHKLLRLLCLVPYVDFEGIVKSPKHDSQIQTTFHLMFWKKMVMV